MADFQVQESESARRNMLCVLPDHYIAVEIRLPHGCGGMYTHEIRCYGPHGYVGYYAGLA